MTQLIEPLAQETGDPGKVKIKANKTRPLKSGEVRKHKKRASGITAGSSEVMVKISSYGKGGGHVKAHLMYISRHSKADAEKIALENDRGELFDNIDDVKQLYESWAQEIDVNKKPGKGVVQRDTMHVVLSMPGKAEPLALRRAVREFAADNFGANHEYVFALHTDTDNDHCHLVVKCRGFDGKQLATSPDLIQRWRESFAGRLRERGIDAEATPRQVRGVVRRAIKQALIHIDNPAPKGRAPRESRVKKSRVEEAMAALQAEREGRTNDAALWEVSARSWQGRTKAEWLRIADELKKQPTALTTKDGKDLSNEPINYERIDRASVRAGQLKAGALAGFAWAGAPGWGSSASDLHQSGDRRSGGRGAPVAIPSVRNVSRSNVVRDQRGAEVFLRANSRNRLDDGRPADIEMRRPRAGLTANASSPKRLTLAERNRQLADQITAFVAKMPEPLTAREQLHRELRAKSNSAQENTKDELRKPGVQGIQNDKSKDQGRSR